MCEFLLEEFAFQIDIEVPQQWVSNESVVPRRKIVLRCIAERRTRVDQIFDSKQHGQLFHRLDARVTVDERITADFALIAVATHPLKPSRSPAYRRRSDLALVQAIG